MTDDERSLVEQAKTDHDAFSTLYERYFPLMFSYVARRVSDRAEAEDIVSKVFLKVVQQLCKFNTQSGHFKAWMYTIATNTIIDHYRSQSIRKTLPLNEDIAKSDSRFDPQEIAQTSGERELILSVINRLPKRYQKVLLLRYYSDLSIDELSQTLRISPNHVSVLIHRALKAFQKIYRRANAPRRKILTEGGHPLHIDY